VDEIVVLDNYYFDIKFQYRIKEKGCMLVCIDDIHDREFCADLIINHTLNVKSTDYIAQPYTEFAIGPKFSLLRKGFLEAAQKKHKIRKINTLLICFGGSDFRNLTEFSLKIALGYTQFIKIVVVTGASYSFKESLAALAESDKRVTLFSSLEQQQLIEIMLEAGLAIVPASGILLEVLSVGCRVISGFYTSNQRLLYKNLKENKLFIDAGNFSNEKISSAISIALNNKYKIEKIIDGNSGVRILKLFHQLELKSIVNLRFAEYSDVKITYKWASNPIIRSFSFQNNLITEKEHVLWFKNKIEDKDCIYFIVLMNSLAIGSVRFDLKENEAIISFLIDPDFHGKGLGQIVLKKAILRLSKLDKAKENKIIKTVGFVMKSNFPSIKTFENLAFSRYSFSENIYKFELSLA
jgi:spore coat polysaccharide biosynthesis predicted glycosyltransferase SpsG/RimJ/RimL family protein N-acetyltransferase